MGQMNKRNPLLVLEYLQVTSQNTLIKLAWEQKEVVMPMSLFHRSFT